MNQSFPYEGWYDSNDLWIDSTCQKTSIEENNDTNQGYFIRFTYDMIQKIINRIKLHETL